MISRLVKATTLLKPAWNPFQHSRRHLPYPAQFVYGLRNQPQLEVEKLCSGLVVATETRDCPHACLGLFFDAGSRYENDFENGIAHFFEHIAFKGTYKRNKATLESQMTKIGARFKCITTREMVVYYVECLQDNLAQALDLLTDCIYNNAFNDMELQQRVIYEEMIEHDADDNAIVFDYLHQAAFHGTTLEQTVMGPSTNLSTFTPDILQRYIERRFNPSRAVLVTVGGVQHDQMVTLASTYIGGLETVTCIDDLVYRYSGCDIQYRDDTRRLANVAIAVEGPSFASHDNIVMQVAAQLIGAWDSTQPGNQDNGTRLACAGSSKRLCEGYKSFVINYKNCGLWGMHYITKPEMTQDMTELLQYEWMMMATMAAEGDVQRARRALKTKLLTQTYGVTGACLRHGRWLLYSPEPLPLHEHVCAIDDVTVEDVRKVSYNYLFDRDPAVAAVGAVEAVPEYNRIRNGMYWLRL